MGSRGRSIASAWAFTALVALTSPALAESSKTITGTFPAGAVPAAGRGFADVKAVQLDSGEIVAAQRVARGGRYSLNLGSGTYQLLYTRLDARAGTFVSKAGAAFTVGKAKAAYQRRGGRRTPGVVAFEVRDFSGATGRLAVMNRGLAELLQTALASADGGCAATPVANSRQRAALDAQRVALRARGGRAPAFTRDLIVPDVTLRGSLTTRREGALGYLVKLSTKPDGPVSGGTLPSGPGRFKGVAGLARDLARTICPSPLAPHPEKPPVITPPQPEPQPQPQPAADTTAPVLTLTNPANGATLGTTPELSGIAGTAPGDSPQITLRIFSGTTATGLPLQTLIAQRRGGGAYAESPAPLAAGAYTVRAEQSDAAGNVGLSSPTTFTIDPNYADPVLIGAGDIAGCGSTAGDKQTAALLAAEPDAIVYTLGDNAYPSGQPAEYAACYDPWWGAQKARTRPITGDHDLETVPGGALANQGFSDYFHDQLAPFGPTATDRLRSYYSYDVGSWHIVALNSGCGAELPGCDAAAQQQWFRDDLAAHPNECTLAMWHRPRFSSGSVHGNATGVQPLWTIAYTGGVDVVLNGHEHVYERFAPQNVGGKLDDEFGVREFVVGTGGYYLYELGATQPNSEIFNSTYGVLKLKLHVASYDWQFIPIAGQTFTDSGTTACHGAPPHGDNGQ